MLRNFRVVYVRSPLNDAIFHIVHTQAMEIDLERGRDREWAESSQNNLIALISSSAEIECRIRRAPTGGVHESATGRRGWNSGTVERTIN